MTTASAPALEVVQIDISVESDIVRARQAGAEFSRELGFSDASQTGLATAISEITRNVLKYAGEGTCEIIDASDESAVRVRVVIEDHGPGIPDIAKAMQHGFSTGGSLGAGLPGARAIVHQFTIESEPGHTRITLGMQRGPAALERSPTYRHRRFPSHGATGLAAASERMERLGIRVR